MIKIVRKTTRGDVTRVILDTIKSAGFLSAALIAPNALVALKKIGIIDLSPRQKEIINRARNNLLKNGFLDKNSQGCLALTKKGLELLKKYEFSNYKLLIPRIWDKQWRMLIFDIPEQKRSLRDKIRNTLVSIGFKKVQESVWIFPYDCEEFVALLKTDFKVGKDLLYIVVNKIENDSKFRKEFNLD